MGHYHNTAITKKDPLQSISQKFSDQNINALSYQKKLQVSEHQHSKKKKIRSSVTQKSCLLNNPKNSGVIKKC